MDREKNKCVKQRRIKSSSSRIFTDEEMEMTVKELARLEKEKSEEIGSRRRVRRLKKESCPLSPGEASLFAEQPLVKGHSKKLSSEEMKKEKTGKRLDSTL